MTLSEADRTAFAWHVLVDPKHKLAYFSIPKVACTQWIQLFIRFAGHDDWLEFPHYRPERPFLSDCPLDVCEDVLTNSDWFKAVFFRDPVERLLSAYLDKFVHQATYVIEQSGFDKGADDPVSVDEFLAFVLDPSTDPDQWRGLHAGTNPHWREQYRVGNVGAYVDGFDFIGRFNHLHEDARLMLDRLGLWEKYGASGWGSCGTKALFERNEGNHRTGAARRVAELFTPEQIDRIRQAYAADYELFRRLGLGDLSEA